MRSVHEIKIDIFRVSHRSCRPYQERIVDFYEDGRPRFEWEKIRHKHILAGDPAIAEICTPCPLNIYQDVEGCTGRVDGLNIFIRVLSAFKPDSAFLGLSLAEDLLDLDTIKKLLVEVEEICDLLQSLKWPVAQVLWEGQPVTYQHIDGTPRELFYEWEGVEEETFPYGNEGYYWGRSQEGIVVKEIFGERVPYIFLRLWKDGRGVYGETLDHQVLPFVPVSGALPAWGDIDPSRNSELVASELPASIVFRDVLDSFMTFGKVAVRNVTGIQLRAA